MPTVRTPGRPRIGQAPTGPSPLVQARLSEETFAELTALKEATGQSQSDLLREAVELLLTEHGSITGKKRKLRYADFRPIHVPTTLSGLRGQTSGVVTLPRRLDWSPRKSFNLDDKFDRAAFYTAVISEAGVADIESYLDHDTLISIWPSLGLPMRVATEWEARFPELKSME